MKHFIAFVLFSLFFIQAIPVKQLFAATKNMAYANMDESKPLNEDKPDEGGTKEKKESKEYLAAPVAAVINQTRFIHYLIPLVHSLPAPYLEAFTPPPDAGC